MYDEEARPKTILANIASSGITELASITKSAQKFIVLNITFNILKYNYLVQSTKEWLSSQEIIQSCQALAGKVGAVTVKLEDSSGLILDSLLATMINEAAIMKISRVASGEDIDRITNRRSYGI